MKEINELIISIREWHHDRNLIHGSTEKDQVLKLIQEVENYRIMCAEEMILLMILAIY